jgi:uncharacterized protein (TIGR02246 family)
MALEDRVRVLEDRAAIMDLIARYAMGIAHRDLESFVQCFASDAVFDLDPPRLVGREQIREFLKDMRPETPHLEGFDSAIGSTVCPANVRIRIDGDLAQSTSSAVVFHAGSRSEQPIVIVRGVEYTDDLARIDGEWLLTTRRHRALWEFRARGAQPTPPPRWPR